jgi:hypothetical protein
MLRIPHCLDNRLIDGRKVVSPTHRPRSTPPKHYFSASGTHFCQRLSKPHSLVRPQGLGKLKTFIHLIGSRTRDVPVCSIVPQPQCYRVNPFSTIRRTICRWRQHVAPKRCKYQSGYTVAVYPEESAVRPGQGVSDQRSLSNECGRQFAVVPAQETR